MLIILNVNVPLLKTTLNGKFKPLWQVQRGAAEGRKRLYILAPLTIPFLLTLWTQVPTFFFLMRPCKLCSHLWWITKRDWVGQRLGWERSELGHRPAGCRHLSKCPLWYQNSILKPLQWWPISFRVKAKILTRAPSHWHFRCPPPWPHFPPLTSPLSCCQLPHLHSPMPGPLHMPSSSLQCCLLIQISGAPTSSDPQVSHQISL